MTDLTLTPVERNRLRAIRELLDLYERSPSSRAIAVTNIGTVLRELEDARAVAHDAYLSESQERLRSTMRGLSALVSKDQQRDMEEAHAQGMHDDLPREGCPMCEERRGRTGP